MFGGRQAGDELLMYDERSKRRCEALRKWKPLEGATLGMVYTYFLLFLTVVFMGVGIWHCRANRLSTEVSCTSDSCRILKQIGSAVQLDQDLPRSTIVAASAVRMEDGKVVETKGLKKRQIQRLNYGAVIKFRSEAEDPSHPNRGCTSWRQTGNCDPQGAREPNFDKPCEEPVPEGASGYCECGDGAHVAEMNCDHGSFSCVDECKGIVYKQDEVLLTEYDMGRRDQRRAVDKIQRYVTDLRINTVEVQFSVGWTWTGLLIFLVALIASFVTCCIGELVNEHHEHQY